VIAGKEGMTMMEIIIVLIIVGVAAVLVFPDFTAPTEKARASNVQNNLMAIYSAEQNYNNNNNSYCVNGNGSPACRASTGDGVCADSVATINCNLSLNIQDDGAYSYSCNTQSSVYYCTATRNSTANLGISVTLNAPIQISGNVNPTCNLSANWCP
jgi:prepilin-type N-terminal cleavage/methylation domain-containing protein